VHGLERRDDLPGPERGTSDVPRPTDSLVAGFRTRCRLRRRGPPVRAKRALILRQNFAWKRRPRRGFESVDRDVHSSKVTTSKIVAALVRRFLPEMTTSGKSTPWGSAAAQSRGAPLAGDGTTALKRLHELSTRVLALQDIKAALADVLKAALELVGADSGVVQLVDESSGKMEIAAQRGFAADVHEMGSTPLVGAGGQVFGVLSMHGHEARSTSEAELYSLQLCAQQAVSSIERLRAVERVHESERRYKMLFESIDQAFAVIEVLFDGAGKPIDYRFLETNPVYLRHTALENVVGKTGRELVPDLEPLWAETFGRVALTGEPERFTQPVKGIKRWLDCFAFRFGHASERQVAVFFQDVTEQRMAEQLHGFLASLDDATRSLVQPEISATATRLLGEHLRVDRVAYTEVDDDEDGVVVMAEWSTGRPSIVGRYRFSDYGRPRRSALREGRPFIFEDLAQSELTEEERERYAEHQIIAMAECRSTKGASYDPRSRSTSARRVAGASRKSSSCARSQTVAGKRSSARAWRAACATVKSSFGRCLTCCRSSSEWRVPTVTSTGSTSTPTSSSAGRRRSKVRAGCSFTIRSCCRRLSVATAKRWRPAAPTPVRRAFSTRPVSIAG
jgi:PAS domain-containing protein